MSIRVSNIRLGIDESEQALPQRVAQRSACAMGDIRSWRILAQKSRLAEQVRPAICLFGRSCVSPKTSPGWSPGPALRRSGVEAELYREPPFELPPPGEARLDERPVIVGSGPAGLFAAYFLAEAGYRPLVLERGRAVRDRVRDVQAFDAGGPLDPESNYLFGEGGAGTFSDGKLTCRNSGPDVQNVLQVFAECKGKPSILYDHRPHLGSNRLPAVVKALRQRIEGAGGEFLFSCRMEDVELDDGRVRSRADVVGANPLFGPGPGDRPFGPRHVRDAAPPRRADGPKAVSNWRANRAIARTSQSGAIWRGAARSATGRGGLHADRPRRRAAVQLLHVRRRTGDPQRLGAGLFLHQRHEPLEALVAVCQ